MTHALVAIFALPALAGAQESHGPLTANVAIVSQYVFRGIAQGDGQAAVQGGLDYVGGYGVYAGTWASGVRWVEDAYAGARCPAEWDLYAGYRRELGHGLALDAGVARYQYPGRYPTLAAGMARPDFTELHLALDWGVASLRYSRAVTNASGIDGSRGTGYLELGVELALADNVSLSLHGGRLSAAGRNALTRAMATDNDALYSYEDASAGLEWKPRGSWRLSIALTTSSARDAGYLLRGRNLGDRHVVAGIAWEG